MPKMGEIFLGWNGQVLKEGDIEFVNMRVQDDGQFTNAWYKPFANQIRQAIIVHYGEGSFILDNEDGSGYAKIYRGGFPNLLHKNLTGEIVEQIPFEQVHKVFNKELYLAEKEFIESTWTDDQRDLNRKMVEHYKEVRAKANQAVKIKEPSDPQAWAKQKRKTVKRRNLKRQAYHNKQLLKRFSND